MASEVLKIDANNKVVAGFVTDDANQFIRNARIDDTTKGLKVTIVGGFGMGTVTSITAGTGLTATPSNPITTSGTITLDSKLAPLDTLGSAGQSIRVNAGATALEYYTPSSGGSVTTVSVVSANGFAGTVANATTTPAITVSTTITGILSGDGTAISAASTTGSGSVVLATSPTFITPVLGVAAATTINKVTITAPATGSTLTIANGKTFTVSNTLIFTGTDGSSVAFGTGGTVLYSASTIPLTVGSTTIASGTSLRVLMDNAGVLGEYQTTGTGVVAMSTSPTFITPTLGAATATTINGVAITTASATLTLPSMATITFGQGMTLTAGAGAQTFTFPSTSATIARTDAAQTFTGIQTIPQIVNTPLAATVVSNAATITRASRINNFTNSSAATMAIILSTSGALDGDLLLIRIYDFSAVTQTIGWTNTENSTLSAPLISNGSTTLPLTAMFQFNGATSKWRSAGSF